MNLVELPFASRSEVTSKQLNRARQMVLDELHATRADDLIKALDASLGTQQAISKEREFFTKTISATLGLDGDDDEEAIALSPVSGRRWASMRTMQFAGSSDGSGAAPQRSALFPLVVVPNGDVIRSSSKRTRSSSSSSDDKNDDDADEAQGRADERRTKSSRRDLADGTSQDDLLRPSTPTPSQFSAATADAVHYETLRGQLVGARLFLKHNTLSVEGEAFLAGLQQSQRLLLAAERTVDTINALRFLEQTEFADAYDAMESQASKARVKVAALEKALGVPAESSSRSAPNKGSLIASLNL